LNESDDKGGHYIVKLANELKKLNIKIIVIGGRDLSLKLSENIINVGRVNNQEELAMYYSLADLTVLTSKRETYSMVCAESLSCGTPVVGFKAGAPETIAIEEYSEFVNYGDVKKLSEVVIKWIDLKENTRQNVICDSANQKYSRDSMGIEYLRLYELAYKSN
jgi:glycosyltransferase involved in cell wall biosynthesis